MATNKATRILARQKVDRATYLRVAMRMTWAQVAESLLPCPAHQPSGAVECPLCIRLYASAGSACKAVSAHLRDEEALSAEQRDDARREQLATLDVVIRRQVAIATASSSDPSDSSRAATAALRALDQRAKLLGLYAPTKIEVTDSLNREIEDALRELAETPLPARLDEG